MTRQHIAGLAAAGVLVLVAACGSQDETPEAMDTMAGEQHAAMMPAPDAAALWAHLEAADYRESFGLWPGKGEFYTGREPHGMLLTTYLNDLAMDALTNGAGAMPVGAIVVKENYTPDSTLAAVTVMYKSEGFDPEHNDWYWLKRLADGTVEVSGQGAGCIACHSAQASNDYLFTGQLGGQ
jgi:hypothetical protein